MIKKTLSFPVHFQDSWLSYCGAVAGALQALGISCDTADAGGYSGYAFLTNVTEGWTDPGSPTLHSGNVEVTIPAVLAVWAEIVRGTESLGVKLYYEYNSYVAACLHEAKRLAARFLRRLAEKHAGRSQAAGLAGAAQAYEQVEVQMARFAALFPYAEAGEMPLEKCREGASILRAARPHELAALDHLRAAHATWG